MLRRTTIALLFSVLSLSAVAQGSERHFKFLYSFTVRGITSGQRVRVWIPLAHSDRFQRVKVISTSGDLALRRAREPEYGNLMLYAETAKATRSEYHFEVNYDVVRRERIALGKSAPGPAQSRITARARQRFLQPDRLVPITGLPAELAAKEVAGRSTDLERARGLYDYVFRTMKYEKTGTGWGRGDVMYACNARKGNCTDFHSLFISMARSQKIPARFQIGFPLPADKQSSEVAGYHCWADFYVAGSGWIPVDISEAWKHPEEHDYFFGAHDANRVEFTVGRDLRLSPAQDGPPLNYFIYPYVEVEGKEHGNVSNRFSFADVASPAALKTASGGGSSASRR